jgi:short-subunit dehydrogenase
MNILITGCGSGLGKSLFKEGGKRGYNMFPHYRNPKSFGLIGDITDPDFPSLLFEYCESRHIDVFINNAAIYCGGGILETTDTQILDTINTNLTSQILVLKKVYEAFKKKSSGLIININSLAGINASANESVYCASKWALRGFSKSLQLEAINSGVEFMDVYSGAIQTRMTKNRENYKSLMSPCEVASQIYDLIPHRNHYVNEIILRRRNESGDST